jgi:hypothetical protein
VDKKVFDKLLVENAREAAVQVFNENQKLLLANLGLHKRLDPVLCEPAILGTLALPCSVETSPSLQLSSMLALCDMFDRKLERDSFEIVAVHVTALCGMLGRLAIAESVLRMMDKKTFDRDKMETAVKELVVFAEAERRAIVKQMELVAQVPTSEDTIQ